MAPSLYGRHPSELGVAVGRLLADPEAVPLVGVPGATERAYATAMTIAREEAIARLVEAEVGRSNAAAVSAEVAAGAVARAKASLGLPLNAGQRAAVEGVLTSGRGVELVVGIAGSGKTTALAAVRDGFEAAGYTVIGTATSGQAAKTLGREAGIAPSRTLASLNWRIGHDQLRLSSRHVAVLDEAAMTDDAALISFLEAARTAGTKVVMVGDHRQLGSVGPGGGFEGLIRRFGAAVHPLTENVRQHDPAERGALAELRAGKVNLAVAFYANRGRLAVHPDRHSALDATVAGWAADVAAGADTVMYAWRRANVAELNARGRRTWEAMGRLRGPELVVGAGDFRAGDRIVTLAPGAGGEIVTSETGTVLAVDVARRELAATMDDGRLQRFAGEDLDAGHLAHAYALTVHRAQGATVARAHALEDGGGRELAYVKMSRAKECSTVYVVADNVDQAVDDLRWSWSQSKRIGWAIDQGVPDHRRRPGREREAVSASLRHARLVAEREALASIIPQDPGFAFRRAEGRVRQLESALADLDRADGGRALQGTPVGAAADALNEVCEERRRLLARAERAGGRERRQLRRQADVAAAQEPHLRCRLREAGRNRASPVEQRAARRPGRGVRTQEPARCRPPVRPRAPRGHPPPCPPRPPDRRRRLQARRRPPGTGRHRPSSPPGAQSRPYGATARSGARPWDRHVRARCSHRRPCACRSRSTGAPAGRSSYKPDTGRSE